MTCTLISHPIRTVAGAGLLAIIWLAAPASGQAPSVLPGWNLVNQLSPERPMFGRAPVGSAGAITPDPSASSEVDGAQALLNTWPSGETAAVLETSTSADGATALPDQSGAAAPPD